DGTERRQWSLRAQDALGAFEYAFEVLLLRSAPAEEAFLADCDQGVVDFVERDARRGREVVKLPDTYAGAAHRVVGIEHGLLEFEIGEAADQAAHIFQMLSEK